MAEAEQPQMQHPPEQVVLRPPIIAVERVGDEWHLNFGLTQAKVVTVVILEEDRPKLVQALTGGIEIVATLPT